MSGLLKQLSLESYGSGLPEDILQEVLRNNFSNLSASLQKVGVNILVNIKKDSAATVSATVPKDIVEFTKAFQSNGALLELEWRTTAEIAGGTALFELLLDDERIDATKLDHSGVSPVVLKSIKEVGPGDHVIKVRCYMASGAGSAIWSTSGLPTTLLVKETNL